MTWPAKSARHNPKAPLSPHTPTAQSAAGRPLSAAAAAVSAAQASAQKRAEQQQVLDVSPQLCAIARRLLAGWCRLTV